MHSGNIGIRGLKHVVTLARHLNYTKAADEIGMTQSALTRSIQTIERDLGARLFDRDRGGVHLTAVGRDFVGRAVMILKDVQDLEATVGRSSRGEVGQISFGIGPISADVLLPQILSDNISGYPDIYTNIFVGDRAESMNLLTSGKIECCILSEAESPLFVSLRSNYVGFLPFNYLCRWDHPIFHDDRHKIEDFPLIVTATDSSDHNHSSLSNHLPRKPHIVLQDTGALNKITQRTDAIWFSSPFVAIDEIENRLIRIAPRSNLPAGAGVRINMYSLARRELSPQAIRLLRQSQHQMKKFSTQLGIDTAKPIRKSAKRQASKR